MMQDLESIKQYVLRVWQLLLVHSILYKVSQLARHSCIHVAHLGVLSQNEVMFFTPLSQTSQS